MSVCVWEGGGGRERSVFEKSVCVCVCVCVGGGGGEHQPLPLHGPLTYNGPKRK